MDASLWRFCVSSGCVRMSVSSCLVSGMSGSSPPCDAVGDSDVFSPAELFIEFYELKFMQYVTNLWNWCARSLILVQYVTQCVKLSQTPHAFERLPVWIPTRSCGRFASLPTAAAPVRASPPPHQHSRAASTGSSGLTCLATWQDGLGSLWTDGLRLVAVAEPDAAGIKFEHAFSFQRLAGSTRRSAHHPHECAERIHVPRIQQSRRRNDRQLEPVECDNKYVR